MKRLTEKEEGGFDLKTYKPIGCDSISFGAKVEFDQLANYDCCLDKLGKLEDIEEELQCPLDFVATPYRLTGLRKIWYRKQYCEVVRIVAYEEATRPYMEVRVDGLKRLKLVFLDDYKNTWFLTKEENIRKAKENERTTNIQKT